MPQAEKTQYPTLHRAEENTSTVDHWHSVYDAASRMEFIDQTVGPVPIKVAGADAKYHLPGGLSSLNNAMDVGSIVVGAALPTSGGLGAGSIGLGALGLLESMIPPKLAGRHRFHTDDYLYAVHFEPNRSAAKSWVPHAAMLEAEAPQKFGGTLVGHTSYRFDGSTWEPHKERWRDSTGGSFEIAYRVRPAASAADLKPYAVWNTDLKPIVHAYALTDQWKWDAAITRKARVEKTKMLSTDYPGWTFLVIGQKDARLYCTNGTCRAVCFSDCPVAAHSTAAKSG